MNAGISRAVALVAAVSMVGTACERDLDPLEPAPFPTDADVFLDGFGSGVEFQAFLNTNQASGDPTSFVIDESDTFRGSASIRIRVPSPSDPAGGFSGGAFVAAIPRDLAGYDALTFWAKASSDVTLDLAALGNDNTGTSRFTAATTGIPLTTAWTKVIVPIPLPDRLDMEAGLFAFADGADAGASYTLWFDEIQYERTGLLANPRPSIPDEVLVGTVGTERQIEGARVVFDVNGTDQTVDAAPGYFTFASSDASVATVTEGGLVSIVGEGDAVITASLGSVAASGAITVSTDVSAVQPTTPAPAPTQDAADVISMFSDVYTDVPVDTWSADFDQADLEDIAIAGDAVKKYTNLVFAAAEATSSPIDASAMDRFRMDIWTPDATAAPAAFRVKLVDFGADGVFGGGDDSEHELTFTDSSTPALATGEWVSLDVPLSDFTGLAARGHIAQLILSGDPNTVFVDNVIFYQGDGGGGGGGGGPTPATPAPAPTQDAGDVVSMFSDVYTDVPVDTWSAGFDQADLEDTAIAGDSVKKYTNLVFAAAEATSSPIDASAMTRFRMDIWTPDATAAPAAFRVKLVDFGADGAFGGGDDTEHELTFTDSSTPALATGAWVSLDVPLSDFTGLAERAHIAQLILSGDPNTVFVDNVFFYDDSGGGGGATEPATPAPAPTEDAGDVVSMFSDVYADVPVDTWSAGFDQADLEDIAIAGDSVKKYTNLVFAAAEATSSPIDASTMTRFRMDIWTPDATAAPAAFRVKLVDFGADGAFGGGDDSEHELTFTDSSTPALASGEWVSLDVPLSDFVGLAERAHIAQLILSGDPNTVFVDNVIFYDDGSGGGGGATEPATPAPTPTQDAGDVVSMYSDAYTDVFVDTWSAGFDQADLEDIAIAGDSVKKYTNLVFAAAEATSSPIDASAMTRFRMDIWTPDATAAPAAFRVKLVDFGPDGAFGGGDDSEHELTFTDSSTPALATGAWVSLDVPLSDFAGLAAQAHIAQLIISGDPNTVFVDNVFFYDDSGGGSATEPATPAPAPTQAPGDVISLYSDVYTDVLVDTWSAGFDQADLEDIAIAGDSVKKYTNLVFAAAEATTSPIDATAMTNFRVDIWTPDATADPAAFRVKLVDFGADGMFGGGDDSEHELTFTAGSSPALATGVWVSLDVPLSDFVGLAARAHIAQLIISGDPNTVFVDNVIFYK